MPPTELSFVVPETVEDSLSELSTDGAMAIAGGTSVGILLKSRLIDPMKLVSLAKIPELSGIGEHTNGEIRLGANTTLWDLARSPLIQESLPMLVTAANEVGNPRVRRLATIGGALVHGDPRQDIPPVLLALDARARIFGPAGSREVALTDFFLGFLETVVAENELLTEVIVPADPALRTRYSRFTPGSEDDYPTVGVAGALSLAADGTVQRARLALGGVDSTAVLVDAVANLLTGNRPTSEVINAAGAAAAAAVNPSDDQRGSERYKRAMVDVWTQRTLRACLA